MVSRNFLGSKSRLFVPDLVSGPKDFSELRLYTPLNSLKIMITKYVHFCTPLRFRTHKRSGASVEVLPRFAKLASFAKNTDMGWSRINFISALRGGTETMSYQPIENYGIIGNMRTVALVGMNGSIDWYCYPHFDSPSIFGAILDDKNGGRFRISADC